MAGVSNRLYSCCLYYCAAALVVALPSSIKVLFEEALPPFDHLCLRLSGEIPVSSDWESSNSDSSKRRFLIWKSKVPHSSDV